MAIQGVTPLNNFGMDVFIVLGREEAQTARG